jgi:hypothetical protein
LVLLIVLLAVLGIAAVAGLVAWIRRAASCSRRIEAPAGAPELALTGDVLCRYVITSGSLAVLELHDWGIRLRGNLVSRWIVPTWEARYDDLAIAKLVTVGPSRIAVWLRLRDGQGAIGFMRLPSDDVLGRLERRGVPVDRAIAHVRRVDELYQLPR